MHIDDPAVVAAVTAASDRYEAALVSNDLATLDALFWHDPRVMRVAARDELLGIETIRRYRAARPVAELARERIERRVLCFGDHSAVVNVVFRRMSDGRIGRQSQTWMHLDGSWRLVFAHISFREE